MTWSWTVAELTARIRALLEGDESLPGCRRQRRDLQHDCAARSGHWYFTLKDANASLRCVMWRSAAVRQRFVPQEGDAVQALGHIGLYDRARRVSALRQCSCDRWAWASSTRSSSNLKRALEAEGLFDEARKRPLPLPSRASSAW